MIGKAIIYKEWKEKHYYLFFIALNLVLYFNTLFFGFVWDDIRQIVFNDRLISQIVDLSFLFSPVGENVSYYRPIFFLSLAIEAFLFKGQAFGFHLGNIILQILVVIFIFKLLRAMNIDSSLSLLTAFIFSIHPSHSEPVSWISARNEILYSLFGLISFYLYIRGSYLSFLFFVLSLLSKETAIILPVLIFLYEIIFNGKLEKKRIFFIISFFLLSFCYLVFRKFLLPEPFGDEVHVNVRVFTTINNLAFYLKKMFFPFDLKVFYSGLIKNSFDREVAFSLITLILFSIFSFLVVRRDKRVLFFILWFILLILPVSGVVVTSTITYGSDRYLYLPSLGLSFLFALFLSKLSPKKLLIVLCFLLFVLGGYSVKRNFSYKDQPTFINEALKDAPSDPLVLNEIGVYYYFIGRLDLAEEVFKKVIALSPKSYGGYYDLARVQYDKGLLLEAKDNFLKALELKPNFSPTYYFLGEIALKEKRLEEAYKLFSDAIRYNKNYADAYNRLGEIEVLKGNLREAYSLFERAYSLEPDRDYLNNMKKIEGSINPYSPRR